MSFEDTYAHTFLLALDEWAATVFFNRSCITISSMAGLVRAGADGPLKLYGWQRAFLRWLEPRLSRAHCEAARLADIARAQQALKLLGS